MMGSFLWIQMILWSSGVEGSRGKLKPLSFHYHSVYDHQTWQDGDFPWAAPIHNVRWPFDEAVFQDRVTN